MKVEANYNMFPLLYQIINNQAWFNNKYLMGLPVKATPLIEYLIIQVIKPYTKMCFARVEHTVVNLYIKLMPSSNQPLCKSLVVPFTKR